MKKIFISFGTTHNYKNSLERIKHEALSLNFYDEVFIYTENDFDEEYLERNKEFMYNNKGFGFWIWKSYFVKKTMEKMDDGDVLVYADTGCHLTSNPVALDRLDKYVNLCMRLPQANLAFQMCFPEKSYTKMDLFKALDEDNVSMKDSGQLVGGIFVLRKCNNTTNLINEYYDLCNNHSLIDDSPSVLPNDSSFVAHRHDQSLFSILRKKRGCIIIPDETWFPNFMSPEAMSKPILATRIRY